MSYQLVKLGDICNISSGQSAPQDINAFSEKGTPFIRAGSLEALCNGVSLKLLEKINDENAQKYKLKLYPKNTIVFAKSGMSTMIGRIYCLDEPSYVVSHLATVIPNQNIIDSSYLEYWFGFNPPNRLVENPAYPSLKTSLIQNLSINLPPLEEQRRIAEILDKADALIQNRKKAIEKLDELLQATFIDMFGDKVALSQRWDKEQLKKCIAIDSKQIDATIKPYNHMINIGGANIEACSGKLINYMTAQEENILSNKSLFSTDHILYSRIRPYLNKVAAPTFEGICSTDIFPIKTNVNLATKEFILTLLRSNKFVSYADLFSKGANIPRLNRDELYDFEFFLPPIDLQKKWSKIFQHIDTQKQKMQEQLEVQETLFKSLQQQAFSGQL